MLTYNFECIKFFSSFLKKACQLLNCLGDTLCSVTFHNVPNSFCGQQQDWEESSFCHQVFLFQCQCDPSTVPQVPSVVMFSYWIIRKLWLKCFVRNRVHDQQLNAHLTSKYVWQKRHFSHVKSHVYTVTNVCRIQKNCNNSPLKRGCA